MTAQDWLDSDNATDLLRKAVRNMGAWAEALGKSGPQDWLDTDNPTILLRKLVHNASILTS